MYLANALVNASAAASTFDTKSVLDVLKAQSVTACLSATSAWIEIILT